MWRVRRWVGRLWGWFVAVFIVLLLVMWAYEAATDDYTPADCFAEFRDPAC